MQIMLHSLPSNLLVVLFLNGNIVELTLADRQHNLAIILKMSISKVNIGWFQVFKCEYVLILLIYNRIKAYFFGFCTVVHFNVYTWTLKYAF